MDRRSIHAGNSPGNDNEKEAIGRRSSCINRGEGNRGERNSGMQAPATGENIMTMLRTLSASMNQEKR